MKCSNLKLTNFKQNNFYKINNNLIVIKLNFMDILTTLFKILNNLINLIM
jgi:hypothetical protein